MQELTSFLRRLRWRYRMFDAWLLAQNSLSFALLASALVLLAGRFAPFEHRFLISTIPLIAWGLFILGNLFLRPYSYLRIARRADEDLHLYERLSTAWVLAQPNLPPYAQYSADWVQSQRQDALQTTAGIQPNQAIPLPWVRRPWIFSALLSVAILLLVFLPNPMDALIAQRRAVAREAAQQAKRVEEIAQQVRENPALSEEERQELARQLAELAEQLRSNPGDREKALADLARMEQAFQERLDPSSAIRQANLEDLARQLETLAGMKPDPQKSSTQSMSDALQQLAAQMRQMSPEQRAQAAAELGRMSAQAAQSGDQQLAQALSAMSQAAQANSENAAKNSLQQAQQALSDAQKSQNAQAALQQALSQLQNSRQNLAQAGQNAQANAQPGGQASGNRPGQNPGSGQFPGGGGGVKADQLPPNTSAGNAGRPKGYKPPSSGSLDDQVFAPWASPIQETDQMLFIPGQDTSQGQTTSSEGSQTAIGSNPSALTPYYQVFYDYYNAANQSIQQGAIPSGLADYVRAYFTQLEP